MKYVGSKNRLSKQIAPIIQSYIDNMPDCRGYLEPFVGGANMIDKIKCPCKIGNDIHKYLIALLNHVSETTDDLPDSITEEEYNAVRTNPSNYPDWYVGLVGFCSFGGKWWGGYAKDKRGDDYCGQAKRGLIKNLSGVVNATFTCLDYKDVEIPDGAVVYCDPPYANTTGYTVGQFDTNEFWDYMRQLSKRCDVYISEESAPDDFECIWSKEKVRTLEKNDNVGRVKVEKLFKYKG